MLKDLIKPSDIDISGHLMGSGFRNNERETIARNIILISLWNGDSWSPFTEEAYKQRCKHNVTKNELDCLHGMFEESVLSMDGHEYDVADIFFIAFKDFIPENLFPSKIRQRLEGFEFQPGWENIYLGGPEGIKVRLR